MDLAANSHLPTRSQVPTCSDPQCFTLTCARHTKVYTRGVFSPRRHAHTHSHPLRHRPNVWDHMHTLRGTHIFQTLAMCMCELACGQHELVHTRPRTPRVPPHSQLAEAHTCVQIHLHNTRAPATSSVRARTYRCSQMVQRDRVRMCRNVCSALRGVAAHVHTHTCTPICMCSRRQASVPGLIEEHVAQLHPSVHLCCIPRDLRYPRISSQAPGRTNTASKGCRVPACVAHSH